MTKRLPRLAAGLLLAFGTGASAQIRSLAPVHVAGPATAAQAATASPASMSASVPVLAASPIVSAVVGAAPSAPAAANPATAAQAVQAAPAAAVAAATPLTKTLFKTSPALAGFAAVSRTAPADERTLNLAFENIHRSGVDPLEVLARPNADLPLRLARASASPTVKAAPAAAKSPFSSSGARTPS